jgi:TonB family protein
MKARHALLSALLAAAPLASPDAAADAAKAVDSAPIRFEDAVPPRRSVEQRLDDIRQRVQDALEYPPIARRREVAGETLLRFEIGADGRARDVEVVRSSGRALLDRAATRAVVAAGVLPRIWGPIEIPVRFQLEPARPKAAQRGEAERRSDDQANEARTN